jgi:hypothetical protein
VKIFLSVLLAAILGVGGFFAYHRTKTGEWPEIPKIERVQLVPLPRQEEPKIAKRIWLDRRGATLTGGADDSSEGVSSIVAGAKKTTVTVPPFKGSDKTWKQIVDCVRGQYRAFDVDIVEERPKKPGYIHAVFGGSPTLLGFGKNIGGLAPYSGEPVPDAVVMIFTRALGERVRPICETAAMEIAHAYGLDHVYLCKDPMSYLTGCGSKSFQDKVARCGEHKARDCGDGQPTQNSHARLMSVLGPAVALP